MRKRKSVEKFLSWVFTVVLLVGMMPTASFAEALEVARAEELPAVEQSEAVDTAALPEEDVQAVTPEEVVQAGGNPIAEAPAAPAEESTAPVEEPALAEQASIIASGTWGTCPWELTSDGNLYIHPGDGANTQYKSSPWYEYRDQIKRVPDTTIGSSKVYAPTSCEGLFCECSNLVDISGLATWDTSRVAFSSMAFEGCASLKSLESLSNWPAVRYMANMFKDCKSLTDISGLENWKLPQNAIIQYLFAGCSSLEDLSPLSKWDISVVSDLSCMFDMFPDGGKLKNLMPLSEWDTSSITYLGGLFRSCNRIEDLSALANWDTHAVKSLAGMFDYCSSLVSVQPLASWDTSSVEYMDSVFGGCQSLSSLAGLENWDISSVQTLRGMFKNCSSLVDAGALRSWDTSSVKDIGLLYAGCNSLKDLSCLEKWDTSSVTDMFGVFTSGGCLERISVGTKTTIIGKIPVEEINGHTDWWSEKDEKWYTAEEIANSRVGIADTYTKYKDFSNVDPYYESDFKKYYDGTDNPQLLRLYEGERWVGHFLTDETDYQVSWKNGKPIDVGSYDFTVRGAGDYNENQKIDYTYTVLRPNISYENYLGGEDSLNFKRMDYFLITNNPLETYEHYGRPTIKYKSTDETPDDQIFTGKAIKPPLVLSQGQIWSGLGYYPEQGEDSSSYRNTLLRQLLLGTDYTASYKNNVNVGTATITLTGINNYSGTREVSFNIIPANIASTMVSEISNQTYTGKALTPKPTVKLGDVTLKEGTDYTLSYKNNTNVGAATITITGKGNLTGTKNVSFKIVAANIAKTTVSAIADQTYTGKALTPKPTVKLGSVTLKEGTDYTLSYKNNVKSGTATITITGKGNLTGTKTATFKIVDSTKPSVANATVSSIANQTYTGKALTPKPTVKIGNTTLKEGTDYTLSYKANTNVGTATITITGKGNYSGTKTATFKIVAADIAKATVSSIADETYTGKALTPKPTVKLGGVTLIEGTDYTLTYKANTNVGTATITITGEGNYIGTNTATFKIVAANISKATSSAIANQTYTGKALTPKPTIKLGSVTLKEGTDYTLSYKNNTNVGTATITITGKGNLTGTKTATFKIVNQSIADASISAINQQTYTGKALTPKPTVKLGSVTLKEGTDYTLSYKANTSVGTATITITGKGNYSGTKTATFKIVAADISKATVSAIANQTYTGKALTPKPTVKLGTVALKEGTDYTLSYKNNVEIGTATVTVSGRGNYTGSTSTTFKIVEKAKTSIADASMSTIANQTYTGKALTPKPTVKLGSTTLKEGTDYTLSYKANTNVGTATVTAAGTGDYTEAKSTTFKIVAADIAKTTVSTVVDQTYTGKALTPKPTVKLGSVTLKEGTDYTLAYKSNTAVGTATITLTGKGNLTGTKTATFKIVAADLSKTTISALADQIYTGNALSPKPTVKMGEATLKEGADYTLSYVSNMAVGTATVTATGKGNFAGTKTITFKIVAADISKATVSTVANQIYSSKALTPKPTVKLGNTTLKEGTDFALSYKANTNVGTATITITGKGNYTSSKTTTFKIVPADISKATISTIANQTYTGSALTPKPTVKLGSTTLKEDTDYILSYQNNTNAGTATITITGKGNYTGTKTTTFKIVVQRTPYDIKKDTWGFGNYTSDDPSINVSGPIPEEYFVKVFGPSWAEIVLSRYGFSSKEAAAANLGGGLCFGFSSSAMASWAYGNPGANTFSFGALQSKTLNEVAKHTWKSSKFYPVSGVYRTLTAKEILQISQIAQCTTAISYDKISHTAHRNTVHYTNGSSRYIDDVQEQLPKLYSALMGLSKSEAEPICLSMHTGDEGHAIWALGIGSVTEREVEVKVYDPNHPYNASAATRYDPYNEGRYAWDRSLYLMKDDSGNYTGWRYVNGSKGTRWGTNVSREASLSWSTPANEVMDILNSDLGQGVNVGYTKLVATSNDITLKTSSGSYLLSPNVSNEPSKVLPAMNVGVTLDGEDASMPGEMYWTNLPDDLKLEKVTEDTSLGVATEKGGVELSVEAGSEASLVVSDVKPDRVEIRQDKGSSFEVTYFEADNANTIDDVEKVVLEGTGGSVVTSWESGDNIKVTGATSLTVSNGDKTITKSGLDSNITYTVVPENKAGAPEILGATEVVAMHRLYNPNSGEHFYTANVAEKNMLVGVGWRYEDIGWYAPKKSNTPVYRLYNPNAGDHHYTMSKPERDHLVKVDWRYEGIGWYSDDAKGVPLYRQYNPNAKAGSHNYTTNKAENDMLVRVGWRAEGIGWYGVK